MERNGGGPVVLSSWPSIPRVLAIKNG